MIDDRAGRALERVVAQVPLARPAHLRRGQVARARHPAGAEVAGLRDERREQQPGVIFASRRRAAGMGQMAREARPAVDLDQQIREVDHR